MFVSWFPPIQCLCYRGGGVAFYGVSWLAASCFTVVLFEDYVVFRFRQYLLELHFLGLCFITLNTYKNSM